MAPPLPDLLRQILEGKQIQNKKIEDFLARKNSLKRYSSSFKLLWTILEKGGIHPPQASSDQIADAIVQLFHFSPAQARNAYSAVVLLSTVGGGGSVPPPIKPIQERMEQECGKIRFFLGSQSIAAGHGENTVSCTHPAGKHRNFAWKSHRFLSVALPLPFT